MIFRVNLWHHRRRRNDFFTLTCLPVASLDRYLIINLFQLNESDMYKHFLVLIKVITSESLIAFSSIFCLKCFLLGLLRVFIQINFRLLFVLEVIWFTYNPRVVEYQCQIPALFCLCLMGVSNYSFRIIEFHWGGESILNHWWSLSLPSNYLNKGPDIVDQRSGKKDVYNDQHYKTENVKGQAAELIILFIF